MEVSFSHAHHLKTRIIYDICLCVFIHVYDSLWNMTDQITLPNKDRFDKNHRISVSASNVSEYFKETI